MVTGSAVAVLRVAGAVARTRLHDAQATMLASGYRVGDRLTLVSHWGGEWPVEVIGHTSLPDDLVVRWLGLRPGLEPGDKSTVCIAHLKEVRRADPRYVD